MLQGSLDDFALDDVLGLLSSTSKSGRLRLSGDRGTGSLWLDSGNLTAAEASKIPGNTGIEDVMFEILRFNSGTFSFMVNEVPSSPGNPEQVDFVVQLAKERLNEWRTIESVVPSLAHSLSLAEGLPSEELTINQSEWKAILAVGDNSTVEPVCEELGLGEVDGSRRIMQMIERGLLSISDPATAAAAAVVTPEPEPVVEDVTPEPEPVVEDVTPEPEPEVAVEEASISNMAPPASANALGAMAPVAPPLPVVETTPAPVVEEVAEVSPFAPPAPVVEEVAEVSPFAPPAPVVEEVAEVSPLAPPAPVVEEVAEVSPFAAPTFDAPVAFDTAPPLETRPPMPAPPSPSEIDSFSAGLDQESPFESGELLDESLVGAEDTGGSILMRYLRKDK